MSRKILLASVMALGLLGLILVGLTGTPALARGGMEIQTALLPTPDPCESTDPDECDDGSSGNAVTVTQHDPASGTSATVYGALVDGLQEATIYTVYNRDSTAEPCDAIGNVFIGPLPMTDGDGYAINASLAFFGPNPPKDTIDVCRVGSGFILILSGPLEKGGKNTGNKNNSNR